LPDLNKIGIGRKTVVKIPNVKFYE